jgi:hypothetical protein
VANAQECESAIAALASRLAGPGDRRAHGLDRSVSAQVTDLARTFRGHLHDGVLDDITSSEGTDDTGAAIRLVLTSDDLVALAAGDLSLGSAWLSGRIKVHASFADLLRLRSMI